MEITEGLTVRGQEVVEDPRMVRRYVTAGEWRREVKKVEELKKLEEEKKGRKGKAGEKGAKGGRKRKAS